MLAVPAAAQTTPVFEVSGGYQFMNVDGDEYPKGWYVYVARNLNRGLAIVGQVDGSYPPRTTIPLLFGLTLTEDRNIHELLVGVRGLRRASPAVVPFGELLVGQGVTSSSASVAGRRLEAGSGQSPFGLLLVGGGVNVRATSRIGVRVRAHYGRGFGGGESGNTFRAGLGVNVPFGTL